MRPVGDNAIALLIGLAVVLWFALAFARGALTP